MKKKSLLIGAILFVILVAAGCGAAKEETAKQDGNKTEQSGLNRSDFRNGTALGKCNFSTEFRLF